MFSDVDVAYSVRPFLLNDHDKATMLQAGFNFFISQIGLFVRLVFLFLTTFRFQFTLNMNVH